MGIKGLPRGVKVRKINLSRKTAPCNRCGTISKRKGVARRRLREVGISGPTILEVIFSRHYCVKCEKNFGLPLDHLAQPSCRFTNRARRTAVDLVINQSMTLEKATQRMRQKYHVHVPPSTLHGWVIEEMKVD